MASDVSSMGQRRFEVIYEAHGPAVLAYCARRMDDSDPADACAEIFDRPVGAPGP
jgi:DNA-directed RNA polymerase specialized sigma24 family protein